MSDPWFCRSSVLRELGLRLAVAVKEGRRAHWLVCVLCGASVACVRCGLDRWNLPDLLKARAHVPAIAAALTEIFRTLAVFRCPSACNSQLINRPSAAVLLAQCQDAAREHVDPRPQRSRKSRKVAP